MKIYIDSACDILYSSYYIYGFKKVGCKIKYTSKYFDKFQFNNKFLALVLIKNKRKLKIIIDFGDSSEIDNSAYLWSDYYYKINIKFGDIELHNKLISIPPSFGVRIYNDVNLIYYLISNYLKSVNRIKNLKLFISFYRATRSRARYSRYLDSISIDKTYVYFTSTIWKNEFETNLLRLNFIKACKSINYINFHGGFAPRKDKNSLGLDEFIISNRISLAEYLFNIKKSFVTYNTPAVLKCHGWKLAEFLALGKVIISTKISRELPQNLEDKYHILFCDGTEEDIKLKIDLLQNDKELYDKLTNNAKEYFKAYVSPEAVCNKILNI